MQESISQQTPDNSSQEYESQSPFGIFPQRVRARMAPSGVGFLNSRIKPPGKGDVDMKPEQ
jgi:hypothetical protein